jgi:hypothetical protein
MTLGLEPTRKFGNIGEQTQPGLFEFLGQVIIELDI